MGLLHKLSEKRATSKARRAQAAAASAVTGGNVIPSAVTPIAPGIVAEAPRTRGKVGMQGHRPIVSISVNRRHCEGCGEAVRSGERHICMYNAEHYLGSMTPEEVAKVITQLRAAGIE